MKIIDIKLNESCPNSLKIDTHQLFSFIIKYKKFFFLEKEMKAYPTNRYISSPNKNVLYFIYVDELGNRLSNNLSQQLTDKSLIYIMKGYKI